MSIPAMDKFVETTLRAFLEAQRVAYMDTMPADDPEVSKVQATYECSCLAFATVAWFVNGPDKPLPDKWRALLTAAHDLVCETGDDYLRSKGIDPSQF